VTQAALNLRALIATRTHHVDAVARAAALQTLRDSWMFSPMSLSDDGGTGSSAGAGAGAGSTYSMILPDDDDGSASEGDDL
jgi:hypothetical protein